MGEDMAQTMPKVRLFVEADLGPDAAVPVAADQANYLFNVMRLGVGAEVGLFNGRHGEWRAEITAAAKRSGSLACRERLRPQSGSHDLDLLFAPLKKARTDFVAEKATEMGVRRLRPVFTRFTNSERVRTDRLRAHAVEAAEQCGILTVPEVAEPQPLGTVLDGWDETRRLLFCDESLEAAPAATVLAAEAPGPWAILIGPEGGFAPEEQVRLRSLPYARPVMLGPRILRADTAAVAALALWQVSLGDWRA
jgi:16S rRNA (uracil1498-N3)-methyltransferase